VPTLKHHYPDASRHDVQDRLIKQFKLAVDFDRLPAWQAGHANRRTGVATGCGAEQFVHQVGRAVDDLGVIRKIRRAVDHAEQPDHALHLVEVANLGLDRRQRRQSSSLRRFLTLLHRNVLAKHAVLTNLHSEMVRTMSRHEQDVADADTAAAIGIRELAGLRQAVAHSLQFGFDAAHGIPSGNIG
jgi:hypothetical protein